jgi:hypothetical protein
VDLKGDHGTAGKRDFFLTLAWVKDPGGQFWFPVKGESLWAPLIYRKILINYWADLS